MKNRTTKVIFLLLAFVFPICIFVFLKLFGRNEFDVPPLYVTEAPPTRAECDYKPSLPYFVPDSIRMTYQLSADSLTVIFFGPFSGEALNQLDRIREQTNADPVQVVTSDTAQSAAPTSGSGLPVQPQPDASPVSAAQSPVPPPSTPNTSDTESIRRCIFFLDNDLNVVMLDHRGAIRGQYTAGDREEMDRLLTEITIILKKY